MRPPLAAILIAAALAPAHASVDGDIAGIETSLTACLAKSPSNVDMKTCAYDADEAADTVLNRVYDRYVAKLKAPAPDEAADDAEILARLVASERAWIAYRDSDCKLQGTSMLGGSGEALVEVDCDYVLTRDRAKRLDALLGSK